MDTGNYYSFICGFDSCRSEFQSERLIDHHFRYKHSGVKKLYLLSALKMVDEDFFREKNVHPNLRRQCIREISQRQERLTWLVTNTMGKQESVESGNSVTNEFSAAVPSSLVPVDQVHGRWFVTCLKCSSEVVWERKKCHIRKHVAEEYSNIRLYKCLLCLNKSNYGEHVQKHVRQVHKIKIVLKNFHYAEHESASRIIEEQLKKCFNGSVKFFKIGADRPVRNISSAARQEFKNPLKIDFLNEYDQINRKMDIVSQVEEEHDTDHIVQKISVVTCRRCQKSVQIDNQNEHVNRHLTEHKGQVVRCFKCLICMDLFETLQFSVIKDHLFNMHQIKKPCVGKSFIGGWIPISTDGFIDLFHLCFGTSESLAAVYTEVNTIKRAIPPNSILRRKRLQIKKNYRTCLSCNKPCLNRQLSKKLHSLNHLRDNGIVKGIYQCLECKKENRISMMMQKWNMIGHIKSVHKIAYPRSGEHFTDETDKLLFVIKEEMNKNFSNDFIKS